MRMTTKTLLLNGCRLLAILALGDYATLTGSFGKAQCSVILPSRQATPAKLAFAELAPPMPSPTTPASNSINAALTHSLPALLPQAKTEGLPKAPLSKPSRTAARLPPALLPQTVHLSKTKNQETRELYITVVNSGSRLFTNSRKPITVSINGINFQGRVFAKKYTEGYYWGASIRPLEEGAIFLTLPWEAPYRDWKQCQSLAIVVDLAAQPQRAGERSATNPANSALTYTLPLHDDDYASDCRYVGEKTAVSSHSHGLLTQPATR